jgi:hypothetical protein
MQEDFDVVIDVLQKHRDKLWEMTKRNMQSEFIGMNIMDDIRLSQMDELEEAIEVWKRYKESK